MQVTDIVFNCIFFHIADVQYNMLLVFNTIIVLCNQKNWLSKVRIDAYVNINPYVKLYCPFLSTSLTLLLEPYKAALGKFCKNTNSPAVTKKIIFSLIKCIRLKCACTSSPTTGSDSFKLK